MTQDERRPRGQESSALASRPECPAGIKSPVPAWSNFSAQSAAGARMTAIVWRATVTVHRYLGIAVGALMLMWFVSGMVMIYVPYPQISATQHLKSLAAIPLNQCCTPGSIKLTDDEPVLSVQIDMLAGTTVMRIRP